MKALFGKKKKDKGEFNAWKDLPEALKTPFVGVSKWKEVDEVFFSELTPESTEWKHAQGLLNGLDGKVIKPKRIETVYNPMLTRLFLRRKQVMETRVVQNPGLFAKSDWVNAKEKKEKRTVVHQHFEDLVKSHDFNTTDTPIPIIYGIHGTNSKIANSIAETGFATLSTLDSGWYGSGMYFTSSAIYAYPYYKNYEDDAVVIICYIIPGNPFPVIENTKDDHSPCGKPLRPAYNSHYVLTQGNGSIWEGTGKMFNEIVINQEAQVMPVYIVHLDMKAIHEVGKEFDRQVPEPSENNGDDAPEVDDV